MDWLKRESSTPNIRLRAMMESGQLVDEMADIIQTQVIAHKARASIRNRDPVPLYRQTEEGRPPTWNESLLVETGLARPPGQDSRYVLEDSQNLFKGIRSGAVEIDADSKLKSHSMQILVNVAAVLIFFGCAWLAGLNHTGNTVQVAGPTSSTVVPAVEDAAAQDDFGDGLVDGIPAPEPPGTQTEIEDAAAQDDFGHGFVDGIPAPEPPGTQTEEPSDE